MVAPFGSASATVNALPPLALTSGIAIVLLVASPSAQLRTPLIALKSVPATAVPLVVA
jgi:hypothetical protein